VQPKLTQSIVDHVMPPAALTRVAGTTIPSALGERIVLLYRGWHALEKNTSGLEIIDFDLSDVCGEVGYATRLDVLHELLALKQSVSAIDSPEADFLETKLLGSSTYLRALMGEQVPFRDYITSTLGIAPMPIPAAEIASARQEVTQLLDGRNASYTSEHRDVLDHESISEPEAIKHAIISEKDIWLQRLASAGIEVSAMLPLDVQFDDVDAYWSNWIHGTAEGGLVLRINLHPRTRYTVSRARFLCLHEICGHATQMSLWRKRILEGSLSQACGVTNVHSSEMLIAEGLAQCVPDILDPSLYDSDFFLNRAVRYHTLLVTHNAHLELYTGTPVDALAARVAAELPFSRLKDIEAQLRDRGTSPLFRTYLLSYSTGEKMIRQLAAQAGTEKLKLFRALYSQPMTPSQLTQLL
jgi:hypothetical protein